MKILFILYDNDSHISFFPLGAAYLASVCRKAGHEVSIYQQDTHHWSDEHLTKHLEENKYDVVGVGMCAGYYQYKRLLAISEAINNSKKRPLFVIGGAMITPEPTYFLNKTNADFAVLGEGELILCELLDRLASKKNFSDIKGIAFYSKGKVVINERANPPCLDDLPFPAWDLFEMEHYVLNTYNFGKRTMVLLSGRGCTGICTFCYRLEKEMRLRNVESVVEEATRLKRDYDIDLLVFNDELVTASPERAIELADAFIKSGLGIKWGCAGRLDVITEEALTAMKTAGCVFINYGMESMDDYVLSKMNKEITSEVITRGVEMTMKADIMVGFNFIFGNLGDTPQTLQKSVDFLLKYDRHATIRTIRPVTPYPGSPLYTLAIKKGLIRDCGDFYENKHTNSDLLTVNFTDMSDDEFYHALHNANKQLLDNYNKWVIKNTYKTLDNLYLQRDSSFRGFRKV